MKQVKVEIITIGDEILIGQIVDTNSAWMGAELSKAGFDVVRITSVHDDGEAIQCALRAALGRADAVLVTGGIGPTKDDVTKRTLCDFFHTRLVHSEAVLQNIQRLYTHRRDVLNDLTRAQALVPEGATIIQNTVGTAPITWFDCEGGRVVVSMPGVPYEMQQAMGAEVIPRLQKKFDTPAQLHKTLLVTGYPESALAIRMADWEAALPANLHVAYLPHYGIIRLRLTGTGDDLLALDFAMNQQLDRLKALLGDAVVCDEDITVAEWLGRLLKSRGLTLSTAESCTGGNIAHLVTQVPGSSDYFKGTVVSYANEVKTGVLGVRADDLEREGAVSRTVVEQMAQGVRQLLRTDWAVATSGIMGPGGGSPDKPVGTVWMAVCSADKVVSRRYHVNHHREQNIERASQLAMLMLRELL